MGEQTASARFAGLGLENTQHGIGIANVNDKQHGLFPA